jgi:hypothetical protein
MVKLFYQKFQQSGNDFEKEINEFLRSRGLSFGQYTILMTEDNGGVTILISY